MHSRRVMSFRRITILYVSVGALVVAMLFYTLAYLSLWENSNLFKVLFTGNDYIAFGSSIFTMSNLKVINSSIILYGFLSDISRVVSNDVVVHIDNDVIREMIRPSIETVKYFPYAEIKVTDVNCEAIIKGDEEELSRAKGFMEFAFPPRNVLESTKHCLGFKLQNGYITEALSTEEEDFPIAFSIAMETNSNQVERLLRSIYRPQNVYCLHVDAKANDFEKVAMKSLTRCFDNVFLSSQNVSVEEGTLGALEADLICMKDLLAFSNWTYFINLSWQDFPLKTNLQLIRLLRTYNGTNDVSKSTKSVNGSEWGTTGTPPHNITPVKGGKHVIVTRQFVDYILHNQTALDLLHWVNQTDIPDELYFSTLNYNSHLGVPGANHDFQEATNRKRPYLVHFQVENDTTTQNLTCSGHIADGYCVFGIEDLNVLTSQPQVFAGNLLWYYQRYALDCLEEWHYNRTRDEYFTLVTS